MININFIFKLLASLVLRAFPLGLASVLAVLFLSCEEKKSQVPARPNIILIVADDLGYSDIGAYGGEIFTPNLNQMAKEGIRLSNMHNAGMCVISRSSMLSGQWWPKVGFGIEKGTNLAQVLQSEGYRTGLVGKWHLDGEPNDKGFDSFFGFLGGYSSYFNGSTDYRMNKEVYDDFGENFYSTDAFSAKAVDFISPKSDEEDDPFFLYLSYQAPHNPLQAYKEDIMAYRGSYSKGWQAVRDARVQKQLTLGLLNADTPLPEYPENLPDWETLSPAQKDLEDLRMAVYAAMVERMDRGIGQLMAALKANGQDQNTLILFLSDNGTDSFSVMDSVMLSKGLLPGDAGSNYQPGTGWAYASVTPKRLYKISQHGGGVKTGALAWWPARIDRPNVIKSEPLHVVDIMPTVLEAAGITDSNTLANSSAFAGKSVLPILNGEPWERKSPLFFQFMDNRAIRTDTWSLVEVDGSGWELYDNDKDPLETSDVSREHPSIVNELENKWLAWWVAESGTNDYKPESTMKSPHYSPQGDRGSGKVYVPSAMPDSLSFELGKVTIE
ncbi:arylsulfatase [Aggregatimonas sangjinii]|uniref:Arylsulfatase n=1 Tax=Aggregatimonas sangjinii TaxID=2583587 RepID=A0A5B7SW15_9FLAO|nr:arylsulfatase [Aggregatimonas sangjinii]QCX01373.1 arylsulfatase [Aggregatimonas sangjinii]